jgi:hypothetical protein
VEPMMAQLQQQRRYISCGGIDGTTTAAVKVHQVVALVLQL